MYSFLFTIHCFFFKYLLVSNLDGYFLNGDDNMYVFSKTIVYGLVSGKTLILQSPPKSCVI